jgi:multimeric flavodoxin WrbA
MKKMLMINGSPRNNGSSAEMLKIIAEKSAEKGYECEIVDLGKLKISHCKGCMSCKSTGKCCNNDDMTALYDKVQNADAVAFATPVYFAAETGLFKNFIDRLYSLVDRKDGVRTVRFGKEKKGIIAISCGIPDGNMVYLGMLTRLVTTLKSFGVNDIASGIVPKPAGNIRDSPFMKDLLDAVEFQLSV